MAADPIRSFEDAVAFALTLPDTELSTSYGKPAVKVKSNGRAFLYTGHEHETSFGIGIDLDTVEMLKETDPDTFAMGEGLEGHPTSPWKFVYVIHSDKVGQWRWQLEGSDGRVLAYGAEAYPTRGDAARAVAALRTAFRKAQAA